MQDVEQDKSQLAVADEIKLKRAILLRCTTSNIALYSTKLFVIICLIIVLIINYFLYKGDQDSSPITYQRTRKYARSVIIILSMNIPLCILQVPAIMYCYWTGLFLIVPTVPLNLVAHILQLTVTREMKGSIALSVLLLLVFVAESVIYFWRIPTGNDSYMSLYLLGGVYTRFYTCKITESGALKQIFQGSASRTVGNTTTTTVFSSLALNPSNEPMWWVEWSVLLYFVLAICQLAMVIALGRVPFAVKENN